MVFGIGSKWDPVYIVPLISRGRALGAINFYYLPAQEPGEDEKVFLKAVADQAAVAVESARLYAEARGKAALEERQRLARDLHDSVSQALYGIALGVETAREMLEKDPKAAAEPLDYIRSLNETGLAEMQALIFELRPESLEEEGLIVALQKQLAAVQARHHLKVEAALCEEIEAPLELKEALYQSYKQVKHVLGWSDYQVRSDLAIRRHWQLICCAFSFCWWAYGHLLIDEEAKTENDPRTPPEGRGKKESFSRVLAAGFENSEGMAGTLCHAEKILEGVLGDAPATSAKTAA